MKPLKDKVSITLDAEVIEQIKGLAEDDDRSFSQYINLVLKEYLNYTTSHFCFNTKIPQRIIRKWIHP